MPIRGGTDEQDGADGPDRRDEEGVVPGFRFCLGDGRRLRTEINGKWKNEVFRNPVSFDNSRRRSASPEMRERPRTVQEQTTVETGSGKPEGDHSAPVRYGPGPSISMQAGGNRQVLCEVLGVHTRSSEKPETSRRACRTVLQTQEPTQKLAVDGVPPCRRRSARPTGSKAARPSASRESRGAARRTSRNPRPL